MVVLTIFSGGTLPFLLLAAAIGHLAICVYSHNWWYGQPLPRRGTDCVQLIHGIVLVVIPILFWFTRCGILADFDLAYPNPIALIWLGYLLLCCGIALVVLPLITSYRLFRKPPKELVRNQSNLVDVEAEVGALPPGNGHLRFLAKLPGNQVFKVDFSERSLQLARLPRAWHGLTILHVSDLHFCGTPAPAFYNYVMERCAGWKPDLVALTGDFVDSDEHHDWLAPILSRLRWRDAAFAIMGNHDQWYDPPRIRQALNQLGMHVLGNSWTEITVRGQPMVVIGNEGPWYKPPLAGIDATPDAFRLCLSHTPDNMPWARQEGIDLMLSGHVHGGQIRFPLIGSVIIPSRFGRRYDCGVFTEGPTVLHVSRGLGEEQPLRLNCAPEVTLLTLVSGE